MILNTSYQEVFVCFYLQVNSNMYKTDKSRRARVVDVGKLRLVPMKDAVSKLIRGRNLISNVGFHHSGHHHSGLSPTFATGD
jgi:hypothetical protein